MPEDKDKKNGNGNDKNKDKGGKDAPVTYETFLAGQTDEVKELISANEKGLRSALGAERDARKKVEDDLRDVAGKLEEGSDAQKKVLGLAADVEAGTVKTEFYEDAHEAGVTNIKLAYHVAKEEDLFDKKDNVDFEALEKEYPELFGSKGRRGPGGAGEGMDRKPGEKTDMNKAIRRLAGRT